MRERGIIQLLPVLIVAAIFFVLFFLSRNLPGLNQKPSPSPSPSESPTSTPTQSPSAKPAPAATSLASPKPTPNTLSGVPGAGFYYATVTTEKGNFTASILSIDLNSARMVTDTANDNDCSDNCPVMPLADYVARNAGFAGVNGTYFCPETYPECSGKKNSFDFPVYNTRLGKWLNGGNLFWNGRAIVYFDGGGIHYLQNANSFGGGLTAGIVNYPGLLDGGNVQIDDAQSGLSDKQKAKGTKVGIGVVDSRKAIVIVANNVNMQEFAYVFKSLGAKGALNLDTGGSVALWYNGNYKAGPGRNIPNAIIFAR